MSKHTPGKWTADICKDYKDRSIEVIDENFFPVATIGGLVVINRWWERFPNLPHWGQREETHIRRSRKDMERIATLIAAAPDLLEACKEYVSLMAYTEPMDVDSWKAWRNEHFQRVRAAIAKAEGVNE